VETLNFASDSASSLSAYVSRGGRFYIEETNDERRIRSLTVSSAGSGENVTSDCITMADGKYLITMPDYPVEITVESEALPVHKLTIEASTPDYSMNGIQQADSRQAGTVYSDGATRLRFSNDRCTSARTNGNENTRRSNYSKITVNDFYKVGDFSWWTSVLAYAHEGKWNLAEGTGSQYVRITNVRFYRVENATEYAVSPSSVGFSEGVQNGRPYIRFVPQDYDMKVTFDVTERAEGYEGWHKIYLHETRPTTEDTVWCNYFYQKASDPVIKPGSSESGSSSANSNIVYNNANPMAFPGTENTFTVGWFKTGGLYSYGLYHVNGRVPHSTIVKSWKVCKANSDGTSTGEEVTLGHGTNTLSFAGLSEGDYLIARDTRRKPKTRISSRPIFSICPTAIL
jgi:hypothetical protein